MNIRNMSRLLSPFHRATRQVEIAITAIISELGVDISAQEAHALIYIHAYGPCPTGEIQRVLGLQRSTLTSMLNRLQKRRYIKRVHDEVDKRIVLLSTTASGAKMMKKVHQAVYAFEQDLLVHLDEEELQLMNKIFTVIDQVTGVTVVERDS